MADTTPDVPVSRSWLARGLWFATGWFAVALGGIGVVVPGLPTTVFMIIAAACFARSSPRFERWILQLPGIGRSVANYRAGLGMPMRAKVAAVAMIAVAILISAGFVLDNTVLRVSVLVAGLIGVSYILLRVPTTRVGTPAPSGDSP